ncbi:hypothetical protein [Dyadobacter sp. Leaf189]|uniref:hypothetical protein n=1 Tax=Dyadobacter sp. Leaf189 TaxID=1736295 RepID=UPI0006FA8F04|nr:hypothetical protein [Dyadobacter sp. Leaf189]KQS32906.1 hypothetical protein ASG33_02045 [Dyadobacter sp. Leaf189]
MNLSDQYILIRTYTDEMGESLPEDDLIFVRQYPTDYLILCLSKINALLYQEPRIEHHTAAVLDVIFPGKDHTKLSSATNLKGGAYFASPAISQLIKACLGNFVEVDAKLAFYNIQFGSDLFKTILIFNERYFLTNPRTQLDTFAGIFKLDIQQQHYIRSDFFKIFSMIRFAFIAKFLSDSQDFRKSCTEFCEYYEIANPWLFGRFFLDIFRIISSKEQLGNHILNVEGMPAKLLSEFTMNMSTLSRKKDISVNMDIIPKPFYRIGSDVIIIDYNFFQYPIDQGLFYLLYKRTSLKNDRMFASYDTFQGYIGLMYFEKYLVKEYLTQTFYRQNQIIVSTEKYQDFIIKSSNNCVLIIEVKNTKIHAKTLEDMDFVAFQSVIDENLLSAKGTDSKNKGVPQLVVQINNLIEDGSELTKKLKIKPNTQLRIFPMIIYSESVFDVSGVNYYVNQKSSSMLSGIDTKKHIVKPVTLLNVNILIDYFALFKKSPSQLTNLISDYFSFARKNRKKYDVENHMHHYYVSNKSFSAYLKHRSLGDQWKLNFTEMKKDFNLDIPPMNQL